MKFSFENLDVWALALDFAEKIYIKTKTFPNEETYGLVSQLRRASLSVSLNIAEGKGRYSRKEFKQFLFIARGSLYETITLMKISVRLRYLAEKDYDELIQYCEQTQSKISGLVNYLRTKD